MNIKESSQVGDFPNGKSIICSKCKSDQVIARRRGYSFSATFKAFLVIAVILTVLLAGLTNLGPASLLILLPFLGLPIAMLYGLIGRNSLMNGCMNCGHQWRAGKE